jgi:hypothetical protein
MQSVYPTSAGERGGLHRVESRSFAPKIGASG